MREKADETLEQVVDSGIKAQIDRNLAKELSNKYLRPENCEALRVLKINKELWNTSSFVKTTKEQDGAFQRAQKLSHIFIRPKTDETYRLILNLSKLIVEKKTFKMEALKSALQTF